MSDDLLTDDPLALMTLERMRVMFNDSVRRLRELEDEVVSEDPGLAAEQLVEVDRLQRVIAILEPALREKAAAAGLKLRDIPPAGPARGMN